MTDPRVLVAGYDVRQDNRFGPARIEHRTAESGLELLGTYFMVFDQDGHSDPWTLRYEETIFVIDGEAHLLEVQGDREHRVVARQGEVIVLQRGVTVRYGATIGTRLLLSIAPVNWRSLES